MSSPQQKQYAIDFQDAINKLKEYLKKMRESIDEMNDRKINPLNKISKTCEYIRQEIEISRDSQIEAINKCSDTLMDQVDSFENDCIQNLKEQQHYLDTELQETLNKHESFYHNWMNYLEDSKNDKHFIENIIRLADKRVKHLQIEKRCLKSKILNNKIIKFQQNVNQLSSETLGKIKYDSATGLNLQRTSNETKNKLKDACIQMDPKHLFRFECLDNGNYITIYTNMNNVISYALIDSHFNLILNKTDDPDNDLELDEKWPKTVFTTGQFNNFIIINARTSMTYDLIIMDCNLNIIKQEDIGEYLISICADESKIICAKRNCLLIYNWEVEPINEIIGQNNEPELPFYLTNITQIAYNEGKYFINCENEIRIINESDGSLCNIIDNQDLGSFMVTLDNEIVLNYDIPEKISFYSLNGFLIN
jgi:hypothetical protein